MAQNGAGLEIRLGVRLAVSHILAGDHAMESLRNREAAKCF
jgi:hypothetical protein